VRLDDRPVIAGRDRGSQERHYHRLVARILLIGGGARGRTLAAELAAQGHALRITTRSEDGRAAIEAAGAECWVGTPDRIATLRYALDGVTLACWLLGNAHGPRGEVRALHAERLCFFVRQTIDTSVRGLVYEAAGCAPAAVLAHGRALVTAAAAQHAIPLAALDADPRDADAWAAQARAAIAALLGDTTGRRYTGNQK